MNIVAELNYETPGWPYGHTREESYCGGSSGYLRWKTMFADGGGGYTSQKVADVPHLCFAHFGELHRHAVLKIKVGWMRAGSNDTFGTIMENLDWYWMQWPASDFLDSSSTWRHMCIDIGTRILQHEELVFDQNPDFVEHVYVAEVYAWRTWGYVDDIQIGTADSDYEIYRTEVPHRPNTKVGHMNIRTKDQRRRF